MNQVSQKKGIAVDLFQQYSNKPAVMVQLSGSSWHMENAQFERVAGIRICITAETYCEKIGL